MSRPFDQAAVDEVRVAVITQRLVTAVLKDEPHPSVKHMWFPKPHTRAYELRDGNPPADADRPKHLRGLRLEVDVGFITPSTRHKVKLLLKQRRQVEQDPTKSLFDYQDARKILETMRAPKKLLRTPWDA